MTSPPISECEDIDDTVVTENAVHLVVRLRGAWDSARDDMTATLERKTRAAADYAASPAFTARFGKRIGVVRVQSPSAAPSIVEHLLAEQGIELEDLSAERPEDGPTCASCGRERLTSQQASITDSGTACPSCLRAWNVRAQPDLAKKPRRFRLPPRLLWALIVLITVLFALGFYYELTQLNTMNRVIRQHVE